MKMSITALLGIFVLALAFTATPVLAAQVDVDAENIQTGADSENENEVEVDNDFDSDVDNKAHVRNDARARANTGGNEQNKNTEAGDIDTGGVDASTDWASVLTASVFARPGTPSSRTCPSARSAMMSPSMRLR